VGDAACWKSLAILEATLITHPAPYKEIMSVARSAMQFYLHPPLAVLFHSPLKTLQFTRSHPDPEPTKVRKPDRKVHIQSSLHPLPLDCSLGFRSDVMATYRVHS
jgi:hypothetical protein